MTSFSMPFGVPTNQFSFRMVRLWELLDAILAGDKRLTALVPLVLERVTKPDIAYLHRQRELIRAEEDPVRRAELYYYATAFAKRHFSDNFLKEFFKEDQKMYEYWSSVPIFGELLEGEVQKRVEERVQEQLQKRMQEQVQRRVQEQLQKHVQEQVQKRVQEEVQKTEQKALQASIMTVLASRFGVENGRAARLVHSIDNAKKLQTVFQRALKANDLNAVIGMLQRAKLPARRKAAKV